MRHVVIVGAGSYVGTHIRAELEKEPNNYSVREMDVLHGVNPDELNNCDVVIHVAGIVHQKSNTFDIQTYRAVNRDLAVQTASEAKKRGASQFLFFSSMSVYGIESGSITMSTKPFPKSSYGISKWEAEQEIMKLSDNNFHVSILRPPMIYGAACPGNYRTLSRFASRMPVFPSIENKRSMIYIGNLVKSIKKIIEVNTTAVYFPQNPEYVNTSDLVKLIAQEHGKHIFLFYGFQHILSFMAANISIFAKVFGSLTYEMDMSESCKPEASISFHESIQQTEALQ